MLKTLCNPGLLPANFDNFYFHKSSKCAIKPLFLSRTSRMKGNIFCMTKLFEPQLISSTRLLRKWIVRFFNEIIACIFFPTSWKISSTLRPEWTSPANEIFIHFTKAKGGHFLCKKRFRRIWNTSVRSFPQHFIKIKFQKTFIKSRSENWSLTFSFMMQFRSSRLGDPSTLRMRFSWSMSNCEGRVKEEARPKVQEASIIQAKRNSYLKSQEGWKSREMQDSWLTWVDSVTRKIRRGIQLTELHLQKVLFGKGDDRKKSLRFLSWIFSKNDLQNITECWDSSKPLSIIEILFSKLRVLLFHSIF